MSVKSSLIMTMRKYLYLGIWFAGLVLADDTVTVSDSWIRLMPPVSPNSAGYFDITNHGEQCVCVVGARGEASRVIEIHEMTERDGIRGMQRLKRVCISAGETVRFEPGGRHLMLIGLHAPLQEGDVHEITLLLDNGSEKHLAFQVRR